MKRKLHKNFWRSEWACKCGCGFNAVDPELLAVDIYIREHFGERVTINSGCRCEKHNEAEGGADDSYHKKAQANDIEVENIRPRQVYEYLCKKYPNTYGIALYNTFVHVDIRLRRWRKIY